MRKLRVAYAIKRDRINNDSPIATKFKLTPRWLP